MNLSDNTKLHQRFFLVSPLVVIALGNIIARLAGSVLGVWSWIPLTLALWSMFALLIALGGGRESIQRWSSPPQSVWGWSVLAVLVGLIPMPLFLLNWKLFDSVWLGLAWLIFALINAPLEEGYWRGLLLDRMGAWPSWLSILYTSFFFAINHPFTFGVHSIANRHPATLISTFIMGLAWAIVYRKTGSLRWAVIAHILVDLFNLSVLAFLNLYVPPSLP